MLCHKNIRGIAPLLVSGELVLDFIGKKNQFFDQYFQLYK